MEEYNQSLLHVDESNNLCVILKLKERTDVEGFQEISISEDSGYTIYANEAASKQCPTIIDQKICVAHLIIVVTTEDGDKFVVLVQNKGYAHGLTLVGGHMEKGESYEDCAVRECLEESGISVDHENISQCGKWYASRMCYDERWVNENFAYRVDLNMTKEELEICSDHQDSEGEIEKVVVISTDDLDSDECPRISEHHLYAIKHVLGVENDECDFPYLTEFEMF